MTTPIASNLSNHKRSKFAMNASTSVLSLVLAAGLAPIANAQTIIPDGNDMTVVSQAPGDVIIIDAGTSTTVDGMPVIVIENDDVVVDNSGTISTLGVTQTIQINADTLGATVVNNDTGVIQADSRAINIDGQDVTIVNDGQILGTGNQRNGIIYGNLSSNNITIINSETGVIDAGVGNDGAGIAIQLNGTTLVDGVIDNAGIIQGRGQADAAGGTAGDGIRLFEAGSTYIGTITNADTGVITSESNVGTVAGFRTTDGVNFQGTLDNAGEISGVRNGVYFGNGDHTNSLVTNTGTISSGSRAFNIDGTGLTLVNDGNIVGTGDQRNGTLYADGTATDFTVVNTGLIDSGDGNTGSGFAAEIGGTASGVNVFTFDNSGDIIGRGQGDAGTGAAGDGFRIGNAGNTGVADAAINNSGTISTDSNVGTVAGLRVVDGVGFQGTLDNSGEISGVRNGVYFGNADHTGGVVTNTGIISSDSRAFNIDGTGLTVNNDGEILGTGAQRNGTLYSDGTAQNFTVNNTGIIDAGVEGSGFAAEIGPDGNTFTFNNEGVIQGRGDVANADGFRIGNPGNEGIATATITNSGLIDSESNQGTTAGFRVVDNVGFQGTLDNSGDISGVRNGVYFGNGDHTGGVVNNTGTITSGSRAFNIDGTGLTLNNDGDILGTGDQRNGTLYADGTAQNFTVNNSETGFISADAGNGSGFAAEIGADGNTFAFNNAGTILGLGQGDAATGAAGDGFRIGNAGNVGIATATIVNAETGIIDSDSNVGTVAGLRVVDGVGFAGTLDNAGSISGVRNGVYFGNGDHTGGVVTNTGVISSDSRAFNVDGTGLTINNSGEIVATDTQRNGTFYADSTAQDFTLNNLEDGVIDAGIGLEGAAVSVELDEAGNDFTINNSGILQGRGSAAAGSTAAGDGIRFERTRVGGALDGTTTGLFTGTVNNLEGGLIASESTNGTTAGIRFVNGTSFQGTINNAGTISGVQNGVYFGNATPSGGADHTGGVFNNLAGGLISSDSRAFNIDGTGLTLNNSGEIIGTGDQRNGTVYADGTATDYTVVNEGLIDAGAGNVGSGFAAEIGPDGNTFTFDNSGFIQGRGVDGENSDGFRIGNSGNTGIATATITNSGIIDSESNVGAAAGFRVVDGVGFQGVFDNSGDVAGVRNGVYFGNGDHTGGVFNNLEDGVISSDSRAFNIDGTGLVLNNSGLILGTDAQRNGTLYADGTAQSFTVNNTETGVIESSVSGSGFAAEIGEDGNAFTFNNAGTIIGSGQGAAGTGEAGDGFRIGNPGNAGIATAVVTNSGIITTDSDVGTVAGFRVVDNVGFAGTLTNTETGSIDGVRNGVYFGNGDHTGGVVNNAGLISSDSRAFNIDGTGLTLNNSGEIIATGNQRNGTVYADGTAQDFTVNNSGTIDAGLGLDGSGFAAEIGADGNAFTFDNSGTIQGRGQGAFSDGFRVGNGGNVGVATVAITNSGLINSESTGSGAVSGLRFVNGVSFAGTIDNTGTISGAQNGVYFGNAVAGEGADHSNGVFNNLAGGVVSSDSRAFNIDGTGLTLNNSGSILGTGTQRNGTVYSDATADQYTINNLALGIIDAGEGNSGSGVSLQSGDVDGETVSFTLNNAGTIQGRGTEQVPAGLRIFAGAQNVSVNGDVTNSGTISSETGAAILIDGVNFTGVINNSGVLVGSSVFDASTALGGVTFNQIGGAFNADFIGSGFADSLSLGGTSFTLNGDILNNVNTTVESGTAVTVSGTRALNGNLVSNGTLNFALGEDVLNVTGDTTFNAGSVVNISANNVASTITLGETIDVITETGSFTDNGLTVNVNEDDFLIDYIVNLGSVTVTTAAADLGAVSDDVNVSALGAGISAAFAAGQLSAEAADFLNNQSSVAGFEQASIALLPALNDGITREIWETNKRGFGYINQRLTQGAANGLWGEASVRAGNRDSESGSVTGYESDVNSFAVGFDRQFTDSIRAGIAYTYSDFNIESDLVSTDETDLQTNQISAYAGYDAGNIFVNGQAGYIFGDGESERTTGLGDVAGEFDVDGFTIQGAVGYNYALGGLNLAPQLGLRYGNISQDSFTETGGLALTVDADDVTFFEGVIGGTATATLGSVEGWAFKPSLTANYVYDFTGDARDVNISFAGAPTQGLTSGDATESRFEIGASFDWVTESGASVGVGYEGDFASGYSSNAAVLRARFGF